MSITKLLKREHNKVGSFLMAVRKKCKSFTGMARPSRSCQIPVLKDIVRQHLPGVRKGVFVEVGAYDGERFSNTSWLADSGWRGIYVEPSPEFAQLCRIRHCLNRVQVVNSAAGKEDGEATLMQIGSLSTMSGETFEEYLNIPWARGQIDKKLEHHTARIQPLDKILETTRCPDEIDLLVVDVEGFEESVFAGFDLERWQPRMLIVELCDMHADFSANPGLVASAQRVRHKLLAAGYHEVYRDEINTVFVRQSIAMKAAA